jgi:hypothetical protein
MYATRECASRAAARDPMPTPSPAMTELSPGQRWEGWRAAVRLLLAVLMVVAGVGHFVAHESFLQ